jgi:two-component system, NtrC family, nitrogen regulation response regulator NtrX
MGDAERPLVLVIDDDSDLRHICLDMLGARGYRTQGAASVGEGLRAFGERQPAVVLLDLKLPDGTGLDVLRELQRRSPVTPVVVVSGYGSVPDAVEAMRLGASEYIEKPLARERLYDVLDRVLAPLPRPEDGPAERGADGARYGMVGRSEAVQRVYQLVDMVAPTRARVMISGERGTGKELVARAIHALSPRRDRPFVQMNCAAVPAELIESEMFGHVKGAFTGAVSDRRGTFESADGGTLFLDEIGDMSLVMQSKLLRVLQEGEVTPVGSSRSRPVDVRILAATSKNLLEEIEKGRFRDDLYDRLNVVNIALPPLRSRREDVPLLAEHYLRLASVENGFKPKRLTPRATEFLSQLPWRGNVRELRNLMERLAVIVAREGVTHRDVMEALHMTAPPSGEDGAPLPLRVARSRFERQYILERLSANRGNLGQTAKELGIERTNLYRKMKQLEISPNRGTRTTLRSR